MDVLPVPYPAQLFTVLSHRGYYYPILYLYYKLRFLICQEFENKLFTQRNFVYTNSIFKLYVISQEIFRLFCLLWSSQNNLLLEFMINKYLVCSSLSQLYFLPLFLPPAFYIWGDFYSKTALKPATLLDFRMSYLPLFKCDIFCDIKTYEFYAFP